MATTKKTKAPAAPIKFANLSALKIAKSRRTLPRGLKAYYDFGCPEIIFKVPKQVEPVLRVDVDAVVRGFLRAAGFKLG